ncbi:DUF6458 family protein [Catellatospora citrea]|uniref:DUF6458 domain-containing protein n=1 Tax=Catellatospora citrea TaxID=53366 RepID=A0A8J3KHE3_9ACTN|nr:DUF6458 family protein [Catellatospora citrea]GIF96993.1 hypothetical protein Cci01nite_20870 [Catellatospora citrea]
MAFVSVHAARVSRLLSRALAAWKETLMGIGASIFLIVIGAILTFALDFDIAGIDIDVIGVILMIGGVVGLIFTALIWGPRKRAVVTREPTEHRAVEERAEF